MYVDRNTSRSQAAPYVKTSSFTNSTYHLPTGEFLLTPAATLLVQHPSVLSLARVIAVHIYS